MELDQETQQRIQELQMLEHNLNNFAMQKQAFQMELNEAVNALEEVKKTKDDIYKMTGSIMLKADRDETIKELEEKKKTLELRVSTIEKQENLLNTKAKEIQEEAKKAIESKKEDK